MFERLEKKEDVREHLTLTSNPDFAALKQNRTNENYKMKCSDLSKIQVRLQK